ncbi:hypothetical protein IL306_001434 [Fusarium sp. DS 682]|nr:hypothetical protein IL306_001434 [Fusarium sp. DS 682]
MEQVGVQNMGVDNLIDFQPNPEAFSELDDKVWGYVVHDACFTILSINCQDNGLEQYVQVLFDVLRSFPVHHGIMDFGHTYEGGRMRRVTFGPLPNERILLDPFSWSSHELMMDPLETELLKEPLWAAKLEDEQDSDIEETTRISQNCQDPFSKLPAELRCHIMIYLKSEEAKILRMASPFCHLVERTPEFYRSRCWPGRDYPWCFDADQEKLTSGQWKKFLSRLRRLDKAGHLENRKRVYKLSDQLRQLIEERSLAPVCCGLPTRSFFEPLLPKPRSLWGTRLKAASTVCDPRDLSTSGTRALWKRDATIPKGFTSIHVSWICLNGEKYISGIRLTKSGADSVELGYIKPSQEAKVCWEGYNNCPAQNDQGRVIGFEVAMSVSGIRGLAVISSSRGVSSWIGDSDKVTKQRLVMNSEWTHVSDIRTKFDALKMVSIAIRYNPRFMDFPQEDLLHDSLPWYPNIPDPKWTLIGGGSTSIQKTDPSLPFVVHFIGKDMARIREIIVCYGIRHHEAPYPVRDIVGIGFKLEGESHGLYTHTIGRLYGRKANLFTLDSASGERLTKVKTFSLERRICGIEFYTNRSKIFLAPSDFWSEDYHMSPYADNTPWNTSETMELVSGEIVSFFAKTVRVPRIYSLSYTDT